MEPRSDLQAQGFIVDEAVFMGGADGLSVELYGIGVASLDARNFRLHQQHAVFEVFGAMSSPDFELPMMIGDCAQMVCTFVGWCRVEQGGPGERTVKLVLHPLEHARRMRQ